MRRIFLQYIIYFTLTLYHKMFIDISDAVIYAVFTQFQFVNIVQLL